MPNLYIKKAILIFITGLSLESGLFAGYFEKGCKNYTYKKYDVAKEMFLKDIEIRDNGNAYYFLGEIEKIEGNFQQAKEYYKESITKRISKKYLKLAYWNMIVIEEQRGNYQEMA